MKCVPQRRKAGFKGKVLIAARKALRHPKANAAEAWIDSNVPTEAKTGLEWAASGKYVPWCVFAREIGYRFALVDRVIYGAS
jgi:hypothetical protein